MLYDYFLCDDGLFTIYEQEHGLFVKKVASECVAKTICRKLSNLTDEMYSNMSHFEYNKFISATETL
mgnify:CR=1 FL=1